MEEVYSEEDAPAESEEVATDEAVAPYTELLDMKILGGKTVEPGDRIILEVVKNHGKQVEVKYASEEEETAEPASTEDEELAQLAT